MTNSGKNVLFIDTWSMGNFCTNAGESLRRSLAGIGVNLFTVNALDEAFPARITELINQRSYEFVLSYGGVGKACAAGDKVLWDVIGLPFLTIYGDSPSYFFDQHFDYGLWGVSLYPFEEHLALRRQFATLRGLHGVAPTLPYDSMLDGEIDWRAKESGKLIFLKNGNDPAALRAFWRAAMQPRVAETLIELSDAMAADLDRCSHRDIVARVQTCLRDAGLHYGAERLMLIMVAQLDDYLRRVKSTLLANVLLDYPVEIHGFNWDHIDASSRRGRLIREADYAKSEYLIRSALATIDMSPNTSAGVHDRVARAAGQRTVCLSNAGQDWGYVPSIGEQVSYRFDEASIRERVEWMLAHPKETVELGIAFGDEFVKTHNIETVYASLQRMAQFVRQNNSSEELAGSPPYFMWPPASYVKTPSHKPVYMEEIAHLGERLGRVEQELQAGAEKSGRKAGGLFKRMLGE